MRFVSAYSLQEGMVLAQDLLGNNGNLLLGKGNQLKDNCIKKIIDLGYPGVYVIDNSYDEKASPATVSGIGQNVLIADDSLFMRQLISTILTRNGFTIAGTAENGQIAFEKYQSLKPNIVTLDVTMPELDGIGALQKIKEFDKKAKVVMITSMGQDSIAKQAMILGADNFVVKPFKEPDIVHALKKVVESGSRRAV